MKKYNFVNNLLGWVVFAVALATYMLTIEPTASFWDCPEFIAQGFKTEIGHPPGNPIFILAANFASKFAGGDITKVSACVNAMSAVFSALTILLLFWTITHLVKKLVVKKGQEESMTLAQYLVIMGGGVAGALAYTWSDTFWFSAVEAEVYAFSSFCTALVFWLILKWENRADEPGSDRWLVLIAYVLGVSLGVHLLNLLCIPAIALVYYYRKYENTTAKGSLITLLISFAIIVFILYGLEPGFVSNAQNFELFFTNSVGLSFNMGTVIYAVVLLAVLGGCLYALYTGKNQMLVKVLLFVSLLLSGALSVGGWIVKLALLVAAVWFIFFRKAEMPARLYTNIVTSILVIFIGFAGYGVILIRSSANLPLDENSPNNVFALTKYLSREQYGESPLFYGRTYKSELVYQDNGNGGATPQKEVGEALYAQKVKETPDEPDSYIQVGNKEKYVYVSAQNMLFPRIHSEAHEKDYISWTGTPGETVEGIVRVDADGNPRPDGYQGDLIKPTFFQNLGFFINYQVNYMYWRYFMWNFAGRQNDIQGSGEITQGNWISGIPFIDNLRLGDQSLLPSDLGSGNKGHNVFFMLPLLLGIIGLLWQAWRGQKGIEQFWVIFFLFFMTGLAIVLYLNQTPSQPRERDYAYAGSFYAFAIWIGLGVAGLWSACMSLLKKASKKEVEDENKHGLAVAAVAALVGVLVPLQMVSQTWDDHDRSGRYAARDFGMNYLSSLDKNAIIFTNGDNDTFPLWYAQEVENYRTDVRVVNLSYLSTDWYIHQMQRAAYESKPLPMLANKNTFAYDSRQYGYFIQPDTIPVPALKSLEHYYGKDYMNVQYNLPEIKYPRVFIPVDGNKAVAAGVVPAAQRDMIAEAIPLNLQVMGQGMTSSQIMSLDFIASSISQGWNRPCYFAMTVPDSYYLGLDPYLRNTGLAYQVTPLRSDDGLIHSSTDKMYDNVMNKFKWGGLDVATPGSLYLDETIRRMVTTNRTAICELANDLANEGANALRAVDAGQSTFMGKDAKAYAADRFDKAFKVLQLMEQKLPAKASPLSIQMGQQLADAYEFIGRVGKKPEATKRAIEVLESEIMRYAEYARFYQSLSPSDAGRLSNIDQYIDQRYFPELLMDYAKINDKGFDAIMKKVAAMGVNLDRLQGYMQTLTAAEKAQMQQQAAQAQPAADTGNVQ
ncbi:MAG: DUF2723 domain-containing protein [Muribaculaceae bacterium]|nr:DUF2723 domain-containing protein [Muribaculaceae bacterium]